MPINVNSHFFSLILNVALPVGLGWQKFSLTKTSPGDTLLYVHSANLHYKLGEGQVPGPWLFISYNNRYTIDFFRQPVCLCVCVCVHYVFVCTCVCMYAMKGPVGRQAG